MCSWQYCVILATLCRPVLCDKGMDNVSDTSKRKPLLHKCDCICIHHRILLFEMSTPFDNASFWLEFPFQSYVNFYDPKMYGYDAKSGVYLLILRIQIFAA